LDVASHEKFSPEIARRLGNSVFTKDLRVSKYGLDSFVAKPLDMLCEIIDTMDDASRSALALVFMRGGALSSPLNTSEDEEQVIARLGGTVGDAIKGLESLDGSLLINSIKGGNYSWHFKHPTVRDAFAAIVASSSNLMDIYLKGASLEKLFSEISCGDVGLQGVGVIVPVSEYHIIIKKIKDFDVSKWFNQSSLYRFLSYRCDKKFLHQFLTEFPDFISSLHVGAYMYASSDLDVLIRLNEFRLLPEEERAKAVTSVKELAVDIPDAGFLRESVKSLLSDSELADILRSVQKNLLPNLDNEIESWQDNYSGEDEPEAHFEELKSALSSFKDEFTDVESSYMQLEEALERIERLIEDLQSEYQPEEEDNFWRQKSNGSTKVLDSRSIFDDIDS